MNTYFLKDIKVGEHAQILELKESELKQRFLDLGLVPGTYVKCVGISPGRDMKAYLIRGAVIAIRNSDSGTVRVSKGESAVWD